MIPRVLEKKLKQSSKKFPVIVVTGPRQSGKTTLVKKTFPKKTYVSLEDIDIRTFAQTDPRGFLNNYPEGAIFDEIQRAPELFSYLQTTVDRANKTGMFILTGSQNFLLMQNISQTLAGRARILSLLPFSFQELWDFNLTSLSLEDIVFRGLFPRLYDKKIAPTDWYPNYVQTYIERDVRMIKNIADLSLFQRFVKMCAARTGQLLNLSSLAEDCGINHNTAKSWIGILEASYICYLLYPHHRNFNKRVVKMPKIYFYDTGLTCSLLGITNKKQLRVHALWGNLFETAVLSEFVKYRYNLGMTSSYFFWRDKTGHEVDCLIEVGSDLIPVEIKSGATITGDYFKNIQYWKKVTKKERGAAFLIYAGNGIQKRKEAVVLDWKNIKKLFV